MSDGSDMDFRNPVEYLATENYELVLYPLIRSILIYDRQNGESVDQKTRYSTSMLITDLGLGECRLHSVTGVLNQEINQAMFEFVRGLGYKRAQFEVPAGTAASRLATYQKTADGLDRYTVELDSGATE